MADRVITVKSGTVIDERINESPLSVADIEW